ncbi:MAG: Mur ligase domain-containing protein [Rickettsiales bacterium]|jgi:UDP-N-acetylmuramate--alanine ligase|nr:Mur ligase domain-containing protein [Rickettsiales bacterium]
MKNNVHFLGINGSGIVGVACLAKHNGFIVSGCDINENSNYSEQLKGLDIEIEVGQSKKHLDGVDKLVVSAAVFFRDKYRDIEEITEAMDRGMEVIRWQQFLDKYLIENKNLICVSGTHGKTTTAVILSNLLEDCGADPSAIIGGINKKWNRNYRNGGGKYFVCEADEYGKNFTYYHPKYIIINNIEMEHPEFFADLEDYKNNFVDFIRNIKNGGIIIFNGDDKNVVSIIKKENNFLKSKKVKLICYYVGRKKFRGKFAEGNRVTVGNDCFWINKKDKIYRANNLLGEHNIRNSVVSLLLMKELGFGHRKTYKSLINCEAPKRRMEKVYEHKKFIVYDDYAHHHTQIYCNLSTLRENVDKKDKIIAILEPHLISRYRDNYDKYNEYMEIADFSVITKFFKSREIDLDDLNMDEYLKNTNVQYIEDFSNIVLHIARIIDTNTFNKLHIVVMGAGLSYKLSEKIVKFLKNANC